MKLLIDMPVTPVAVARLKVGGHEAVHASGVGMARAKDSEILDLARTQAASS